MTNEELSYLRELGKKCKAKGCLCLARCYRCWNKWWHQKAQVCTHPNWCPADTEWWEDDPPLVGNKLRPKQQTQSIRRPTIEDLESIQNETEG